MSFFMIFMMVSASSLIAWWYQNQQKQIANKVSDKEVIELARQNNGEMSQGFLVTHTELTASEADMKVQELINQGILHYTLNSSFRVVYKLDKGLLSGKLPTTKKIINQVEEPKSYADGDVIALAVKQQGKISAAALCMKAKMSIEQAEEKLKSLHEKGVFEIQVTENGAILYVLNDLGLLEN